MRLIVFGPHGSGKGIQAKKISTHYKIPYISTGEVIRDNIKHDTELGKHARKYVDNYLYVPDELVNKIVEDRIHHDDCKKGFVLDGYPRTLRQIVFLDKMLAKMGVKIDAVINLKVSDEELIKRLLKRGKQEGRKEDLSEKGIKRRMEEYNTKALHVLDYYKKKTIDINGEQTADKVFQDIKKLLDKMIS